MSDLRVSSILQKSYFTRKLLKSGKKQNSIFVNFKIWGKADIFRVILGEQESKSSADVNNFDVGKYFMNFNQPNILKLV